MFIKVKKAKHIYEVYQYERLNLKPIESGDGAEYGESENADQNYLETVRRRRETVRDLAVMNFDNSSKFVTLTFRDTDDFDIKDIGDCNHEFKKFIQRLKRSLPDHELKYLAVIEFQKRGAIHYHMLANLPFIEANRLEQIWRNGFIKINAIDKVDNLGAYVTKYMTKDKADDRLRTEKGYFCTKGLDRPEVLKSWDLDLVSQQDRFMQLAQEIEGLEEANKKVFRQQYQNTELGLCTYEQYNANRERGKACSKRTK